MIEGLVLWSMNNEQNPMTRAVEEREREWYQIGPQIGKKLGSQVAVFIDFTEFTSKGKIIIRTLSSIQLNENRVNSILV